MVAEWNVTYGEKRCSEKRVFELGSVGPLLSFCLNVKVCVAFFCETNGVSSNKRKIPKRPKRIQLVQVLYSLQSILLSENGQMKSSLTLKMQCADVTFSLNFFQIRVAGVRYWPITIDFTKDNSSAS